MKQFRVALFLCLFSLVAFSQNYQCQFGATIAASGFSTSFDNRSLNCYNFRVTYTSTGFSAISIQLESAPDVSGTPGSWSAFAGATVVTDGTNPSTSTNTATIGIHSSAAWVRINLVTATGTGTLKYQVFGASGVNASNSNLAPLSATNGTNNQGLTSNGSGTFGTPITFAASATTDTTNGTNISSGTIASARGGAGAITGALKGSGAGVVTQAACADLSDATVMCHTVPGLTIVKTVRAGGGATDCTLTYTSGLLTASTC